MKGLCRIALAALFVAACGRDSAMTGLDDPMAPPAPSSGGGILAIGVDSTTGASIETNKDDYSPGEVVHLVGRGWAAGETVNLHMTEAPNTHADVDTNVAADASGAFSVHFYDVQPHDLGVTFTLTATGSASHSRAIAVFTDGNFALRAFFTPAGGPSFTGTILKFAQSTTCDPSTTGQSTINTPAVTTSAGPQAGINEDNSALITVPATVGSYSFSGWSISDPVTFVTGSTSTPSICVVGTTTGNPGARTFTANYVVTNTAPTVNAGSPYTGTEGAGIALSGATASDADGDPLTYKWTVNTAGIDGGGVCTFSPSDIVLNPSVMCTDDSNPPGKFTLTLEVKDGAGGHTVTRTADLTVNNATPTATAGGPYGGNVNSNIALNGNGDDAGNNDDAGLTYAWSVNTFGNGTCSFAPNNTTKNATVNCTNPSAAAPGGVFKLSLTASDDDGGTSAASVADLTITNQAPTSVPGGPYNGNEGSAINISGSGVDPDGGTVTFEWSVSTVKCSFANANAASTTVTCTDNGAFTLTLKATDDEGAFTTNPAALSVANVKPTIGSYTLGVSVNEGSSIPFAVGNVTDPSSDDQSAGFEYAFACGANPYGPFTNSNTTSCNAGDGPGNITIKGKAKDKDGAESDEVSATFGVVNVKPTITAATTNSPVNEGTDATLTVTTVTDPWAGDLAGAEYAFSCGGAAYGGFGPSNSVNCPTTDGPATLTIGAKVKDKDGAISDAFTQNVTVANVAPTVTGVTAPSSVNEGPGTFAFSATGVTDPSPVDQASPFQYAFSCDNGSTWTGYSTINSGLCGAPDGPGTITVAVKAKDKDGGESLPVSKAVTVVNLKPTVTGVTTPSPVNEGPSFSFSATSVTDPSPVDQSSPFQYAFSCDNGATWSAYSTTNSGTCAAADGPATVNVAVKAKDKDGAESDAVGASVTVQNVAPTVTGVTAPTSVVEGPTPFTFSATNVTDPSTPDASAGFQYAFSCDNGATWSAYSTTNSGSCAAPDGPATINVAVKAKDKDGGESLKATAAVNVTNEAPVINTPLVLPASPVAMGSSFSMSWTFTDAGSDSWSCRISWDLPVSLGAPVNSSGKTCSISGASLTPGVYTVTVYVADDDGGSDQETAESYIVVYDPNGGFVTGGGWINSLAGYYRLNPAAAGKANFGFVSKYVPGKTVPTGNTEFQFQAGDLNFKSTVYEWLVVAGDKAMYKGEGTIAGRTGVYMFLLSAIDGSPDKFRIKIWEKTAAGTVVYDTLQDGAADDADPSTTLGGGSIVVHTKK